jgi:hypothetical protein
VQQAWYKPQQAEGQCQVDANNESHCQGMQGEGAKKCKTRFSQHDAETSLFEFCQGIQVGTSLKLFTAAQHSAVPPSLLCYYFSTPEREYNNNNGEAYGQITDSHKFPTSRRDNRWPDKLG